MSSSNIKRKLVAILAADAVGFSKQMGRDEERTARVLAAHRAVIDGIIEFHEGRIVGTAGDSVLAEFASPVQALRCAVEIQDAIHTRNDALPDADRMQFRIGVNLGDVMVKGDDLLGDGVNVAARLEGIAEPGGICISSSVYDQIAGKLDLGFVEIGEQKLKNIPRPIRVYRVSGSRGRAAAAPPTKRPPAWAYALAGVVAMGGFAAAWLGGAFDRTAPQPVATSAPVAAIAPPVATPPASNSQEEARLAAAASAREAEARAAEVAKAKADAEIAKARADMEVARARAETATLQRKAAAELAAARTIAAKPEQPEKTQRAPEKEVTPVKAEIPGPPDRSSRSEPPAKPAAVALAPAPSAAVWTAQRKCDPMANMGPLSDEVRVRRAGDELILEKGAAGEAGHFLVRGQAHAEGRLVLSGTVNSPMAGREIPVHYEGRLEGDRYELQGRMGRRPCTLSFSKQP